jgi:hypothetical protein
MLHLYVSHGFNLLKLCFNIKFSLNIDSYYIILIIIHYINFNFHFLKSVKRRKIIIAQMRKLMLSHLPKITKHVTGKLSVPDQQGGNYTEVS